MGCVLKIYFKWFCVLCMFVLKLKYCHSLEMNLTLNLQEKLISIYKESLF